MLRSSLQKSPKHLRSLSSGLPSAGSRVSSSSSSSSSPGIFVGQHPRPFSSAFPSSRIRQRSSALISPHTRSSSLLQVPRPSQNPSKRLFSSPVKDETSRNAGNGRTSGNNQNKPRNKRNNHWRNNKGQNIDNNNSNSNQGQSPGGYWSFAGNTTAPRNSNRTNKNTMQTAKAPASYDPLTGSSKKDSNQLFEEYKTNFQNITRQNKQNNSNGNNIGRQSRFGVNDKSASSPTSTSKSLSSSMSPEKDSAPSPLQALRKKFAAMKERGNESSSNNSNPMQQILGSTPSNDKNKPPSLTSFGGQQQRPSDQAPIMGYLDEYVKNMAERREQQRKEQEAGRSSSPLSILDNDSNRNTRRDVSLGQQRQDQFRNDRNHQVDMARSFMENQRRQQAINDRKSRQNRKRIEDETVVLPLYAINLTETSLLFRVAAKKLAGVLKRMGEWPADTKGKDDRHIMIEPETLQLLAMELGRDFQLQESQGRTDDRDVLLQRRALAEQDDSMVENDSSEAAGAVSSQNDKATPYESLPPRPPVVCIMGHVDHGKTTLMDTLRRMSRKQSGEAGKAKKKKKKDKKRAKTANKENDSDNVAGTEAGGITQVITAFEVPLEDTGSVTFLDTPGHAAFKSMRQSGSDAADIIVLVVAADDGVSPQTIEIINFYKSIVEGSGGSGISLVVAMNKIDKPGINVDEARMRIEGQLLEHGIMVEGMVGSSEGTVGSPAQLFPISGLTGEGVEDLVEGLALQSEVMDLRADDSASAEGYVMDARVQKGLGTVVDSVIRWGSIQKGDFVLSGTVRGKVRLLMDVNGKPLKKGTPSQPVRITGFDGVPKAGDPIICLDSEEELDELLERRIALEERNKANNEEIADPLAGAELQSAGKHFLQSSWKSKLEEKHGLDDKEENTKIRIPVIIRADADGTLSAIRDCLVGMGEESQHNVVIDPIATGVGPVLAAEIQLAKESGATIVCFNVKANPTTSKMADDEGVPLLTNDVIYRLLEESRVVFGRHLPPKQGVKVVGRAKVGAVYDIGGIATRVAGLTVTEGTLYKSEYLLESGEDGRKNKKKVSKEQVYFRVLRNREVISEGEGYKSTSLKHFKDDVEEVARGDDCGLSLESHNDYEKGDIIECFVKIEEVQSI